MGNELIAFIGPLVGVLVGSIGTIAITWITKHYEEQSSYRKMVIETAMEYYKEAIIATRNVAKNSGKKAYVWPYESFVISIAHLVNRVVNKAFKIDDLDEIVSENKRLIRTLEKSYSEINKKQMS